MPDRGSEPVDGQSGIKSVKAPRGRAGHQSDETGPPGTPGGARSAWGGSFVSGSLPITVGAQQSGDAVPLLGG